MEENVAFVPFYPSRYRPDWYNTTIIDAFYADNTGQRMIVTIPVRDIHPHHKSTLYTKVDNLTDIRLHNRLAIF